MKPSKRRPGPESTLEDVRSDLIAAAIHLLQTRGVDVGFDDISMSDVITQADVSRSTAYRSLADDELAPQGVLHRELMQYLLTRFDRGNTRTAVRAAVEAELERQADNLASDDIADRTRALRSILRVGANRSFTDVAEARERAILISLYGALQSAEQPDWRYAAVREGEQGLTKMFGDLYTEFLDVFDYTCKPGVTLEQFTVSAAAMIEGLAMRNGFNDAIVTVQRPTGDKGALDDWTLFAISFEALLTWYFEPGNPGAPFADLTRY